MIQIMYMSTSSGRISSGDLKSLLEPARRNNADLGVTGFLLYKDGNFLQVLEGSSAVVDELFFKISLDRRHRNVTRFFRDPILERNIPDWTMGFLDLDNDRENSTEVFNGLLKERGAGLPRFSNKVAAFVKMFVPPPLVRCRG